MLNFVSLDRLAAGRGDGLRPELRELFQHRSILKEDPKLEDLAAWRSEPMQAGPHPSGGVPGRIPASVLRFPDPRECFSTAAKKRRKA